MEGSAPIKTREIIRRDTHEILLGGLPAMPPLLNSARLRVTNAQAGSLAGTKFWRRASSCKTAGKAQEDTGAAGGGGRHSF